MSTPSLPGEDDPSDTAGRSDAGLLAALSLTFALAPFGLRVLAVLFRYALMAVVGGGSTAMAPFEFVQQFTSLGTLLTSSVLGPLAVVLGVLVLRHPAATERQLRVGLAGMLVGAFATILILINVLVFVLS